MKTVAVFVDVKNVYFSINRKYPKRRLNYEALLLKICETHSLFRALAYGGHSNGIANKFIGYLKHLGFDVFYKDRAPYNCTVEMALDIVRIVGKVEKVILVTTDPDFYPVAVWVQEQGIECDVIGCNISRDLKMIANRWTEIDDSYLMEESHEAK